VETDGAAVEEDFGGEWSGEGRDAQRAAGGAVNLRELVFGKHERRAVEDRAGEACGITLLLQEPWMRRSFSLRWSVVYVRSSVRPRMHSSPLKSLWSGTQKSRVLSGATGLPSASTPGWRKSKGPKLTGSPRAWAAIQAA
jgi:hypothetical protein